MNLHCSRITLLRALALLSWACTADDVGSPSRLTLAADLTIADSAVVVFGLDQDSLGYDLSGYSDARVLSDGRLAVFCRDQSLLIFSADGNLESSFGGRGEGPGQFRMAHVTRLSGDTLLVYDAPSRRVSWIHPSRGLDRTIGLGTELPPQYLRPLGVRRDGGVVLASLNAYSQSRIPVESDSIRTVAEVVVAFPDGRFELLFGVTDLLLIPRNPPSGVGNVKMWDNVRYGGGASIRVSEGQAFAIAGGSRHLEVRSLEGSSSRDHQLTLRRLAVSDRDRTEFVEAEIAPLLEGNLNGHPPPPDVDASMAFLRSAVFADSFPPASDLLVDVDGDALWVVHGGPFDAPLWSATKFSLDGRPISTLEASLPLSRPVAFKGSDVLVARWDEVGVTWFEMRRLVENR